MLTEGPTDREAELVSQHFGYLKKLLEDGVLILAGRTQNSDESSFGIVIFRAVSESEAKRVMEKDPAVDHGVMQATLFPYKVAIIETRDA
jgi:uncharacterized protein YciI